MEEHEDIIVVIGILKNKIKEDLEGECNFTEEEKKLSEDENITERNKEEDKKEIVNDCSDSELNKKVKENQRQLVIKLLKEGYRVDKICNMLELTYSQIDAIVNGEDF